MVATTPVPPLHLPEPSLVLLVGVAGCGKSTFAARRFLDTEVVSSDRCRALICDDPADQTVTGDAFSLLITLVDKRLRHGRLTVVDATNVQKRARKRALGVARRHELPAAAIVLDLPFGLCRDRDAGRPDPVGEEVQRRQHEELVKTRTQLADEGYAVVHHLTDPEELATREVVRFPLEAWPPTPG